MSVVSEAPLTASDTLHNALTSFLSQQVKGDVVIKSLTLLSGGAIQQNRLIVVDVLEGEYQGVHEWVVRSDASTVVSESMSRHQEYQLLRYAHQHGVTVAKPLWYGDASIFGYEFFVMEKVNGITRPTHLSNPKRFSVDRDALTATLGTQLARIHNLNDDEALSFLIRPNQHPAAFWLERFSTYLSSLNERYPILELALRRLQATLPDSSDLVMSHRDFRLGNIMVNNDGLSAILDWEFCAWSDPHEDLGWFCAPCWRFSARDKAAGGLGDRATLYQAYEQESGRSVNDDSVRYWEMFATLRWAIIAIEQGYRHLSNEPSLELALTAHIVPELEQDLLDMMKENMP